MSSRESYEAAREWERRAGAQLMRADQKTYLIRVAGRDVWVSKSELLALWGEHKETLESPDAP